MENERETQAADALSLIGMGVFVGLLRSLRDSPGCLAVTLANDRLDEGKSLQDLFFTDEPFGYYLGVEEQATRRYIVRFGYAAAPDGLAGDGASWRVTLDRNDDIVRVEMLEAWIH